MQSIGQPGHPVCSAHFPGGVTMYDSNIPTILDTRKHLKQRRIIVKHVAPVSELSVQKETSSIQLFATLKPQHV